MNKQRRQEGEKVNKMVASYLRGYKSLFPDFIQSDEIMWNLLEQKTITLGIRSYIAYKLYNLSGGQNWEKVIGPLLGAIEMSIVSTYATNRIFDQKKGGKTDTEVIKSIMASALARDGMYHILHTNYNPELISRLQLWYEISNIHRWFYQGQYINSFKNILPDVINKKLVIENLPSGFSYVEQQIDKVKSLVTDKIKDITDNELDNFLKNQFLRLYLINSHFYERFAVLGVRMHKDITSEQESFLEGFGALYGVGSQIVNDVIDFALPSMNIECMAKTKEDFFNDLKNRLATFPIFLGVYAKNNSIQKEILSEYYFSYEDRYLSESQMEDILYYLIDSKAIQISLQIALLCLEEAKTCLEKSYVLRLDNALRDIFRISKESRFIVNMFKWYRKQKQLKKEVSEVCQVA
ncbi:MAG: hypothetical protein AB1480_14665 [Nitrospirota bacterium]